MTLILFVATALGAYGTYAGLASLVFACGAVIVMGCWWDERDNIGEGRPGRFLVVAAALSALSGALFALPSLFILLASAVAVLFFRRRILASRALKERKQVAAAAGEVSARSALEEAKRSEEGVRDGLNAEVNLSRALRSLLSAATPDEIVAALDRSVRQLGVGGDPPPSFAIAGEDVTVTGAEDAASQEVVRPLVGQARLSLLRSRRMARLKEISRTDWLTGLPNRRALDEAVVREAQRSASLRLDLTYLMLDIDHFKTFNDTHGHAVGDFVLMEVANLLRSLARKSDFIARYGGEEFVLLLPETPLEKAATFAERIRKTIEEAAALPPGHTQPLRVTVSVGVSSRGLAGADEALYQSKETGRNRVTTG